jgi:hypothetical protein
MLRTKIPSTRATQLHPPFEMHARARALFKFECIFGIDFLAFFWFSLPLLCPNMGERVLFVASKTSRTRSIVFQIVLFTLFVKRLSRNLERVHELNGTNRIVTEAKPRDFKQTTLEDVA